jgi:hypothetical protein
MVVTTKSLLQGWYKTKYTDDMLLKALESVQNGQMSGRAAAEAYGTVFCTRK